MSEWIKASERLPEENGMYLTIAYTKELVTNGWAEMKWKHFVNGEWVGLSEPILYWRPIPEFPEELVSADE